jgi:hypothetical protein
MSSIYIASQQSSMQAGNTSTHMVSLQSGQNACKHVSPLSCKMTRLHECLFLWIVIENISGSMPELASMIPTQCSLPGVNGCQDVMLASQKADMI